MSNPEHLAILKQGVKVWNEWRKKNPEIRPDLVRAELQRLDLRNVDFTGANPFDRRLKQLSARDSKRGPSRLEAYLRHDRYYRADFYGADLNGVDFTETNLSGADLSGANLSRATLNGANLTEANLTSAILKMVNLEKTNLTQVTMGWTNLEVLDLSAVEGLETVQHSDRSNIDIDTIYISKGNIPEIFLRGCGVPENLITFMHSLTGKAFNFYSCFISHSAKDKLFCERLYADLQAKGVRVWYFPEDAKWGETVWGEIDRSIKVYDKLIVVCSENSLQSIPVNREIERALTREDKESKGILFPIRIDDYIFNTWEHERKADVVRKVVGDFSGWNGDAAKYEKAFEKLLKGLQAA